MNKGVADCKPLLFCGSEWKMNKKLENRKGHPPVDGCPFFLFSERKKDRNNPNIPKCKVTWQHKEKRRI